MKYFKNDNYYDNNTMSNFILSKYKANIDKYIDTVLIFPKDYHHKETLAQRWKVYFYYDRNGKQTQFNRSSFKYNGQNIQVNRVKNHKLKITYINMLKDLVIYNLRTDPKLVVSLIYGYDEALRLYPNIFEPQKITRKYITIEDAFKNALEFKKSKVSHTFYKDMLSASNRFLKFIGDDITSNSTLLNKKMLLDYLDSLKVGNKTYNNAKSNLSALLSVMVDKEYIKKNFIKDIKNLKETPKINKAFTQQEIKTLFEHLKDNDVILYYYCLNIYYGLMRPITINRIKVKDIDLKNKSITTETKTGNYLKIIPEILFNEFYKDLELTDSDNYLFAYNSLLMDWDAEDLNRRDHYTKKFLKVKKALGFDKNYTLYSFRHSAIGQIYDNKYKELKDNGTSDYRIEAIKYIMQFTEHKTIDNVKKYLRGITTVVHVDWSKHLK